MPPVMTLAPGEAIPGPWGLFEALLVLTFAAHILVINVALGGTLLTLFAPGTGRETAMGLAKRIHDQALVLTSADLYLVMACIAVALICLIPFVPTRVYPPRAVA